MRLPTSPSSLIVLTGALALAACTNPNDTGTSPDGSGGNACTVSCGTWTQGPSMPTARTNGVGAAVDNLVYAIAGSTTNLQSTNSVEVLNTTSSQWSPAPSLARNRRSPAAAVVGGTLHVFGGFFAEVPNDVSTVEALVGGSWATRAPMPTFRQGAAAVAQNGLIYVIGGQVQGAAFSTAVDIYNPATNAWSSGAPLPTSRSSATVEAVSGRIYVIGGFGTGGNLTTVEIFDPAQNSWTTGAPMPEASAGAASGAINGLVYTVLGSNKTFAYNPATNSWSRKADFPSTLSPIQGRMGTVAGGKLYVLGGSSNGVLAQVHTFTP